MSTIQTFCLLSTTMFVVVAVMLSSNNLPTKILQAGCFAMALFGAIVTASVFGFAAVNGQPLL